MALWVIWRGADAAAGRSARGGVRPDARRRRRRTAGEPRRRGGAAPRRRRRPQRARRAAPRGRRRPRFRRRYRRGERSIALTGWRQAGPLVSLLIAALVLVGAWRLLHETLDVLLEWAPHGIDIPRLETAMCAVPGVAAVHDVHVWTVTSGFVAMSGHVELDGARDAHAVLDTLTETLAHDFNIAHVTIQPEPAPHASDCCAVMCDGPRVAAPAAVSPRD
ncbi:MAG: cation diffusion facilitator family transporter [Dehalococcoidia bacterium]